MEILPYRRILLGAGGGLILAGAGVLFEPSLSKAEGSATPTQTATVTVPAGIATQLARATQTTQNLQEAELRADNNARQAQINQKNGTPVPTLVPTVIATPQPGHVDTTVDQLNEWLDKQSQIKAEQIVAGRLKELDAAKQEFDNSTLRLQNQIRDLDNRPKDLEPDWLKALEHVFAIGGFSYGIFRVGRRIVRGNWGNY